MIRGTSQPFKFKMPYDFEELKTLRITFWQKDDNRNEDQVLIVKEVLPSADPESLYDWAQYDGKEVCVVLDQHETLQFSTDRKAYAQLKASTADGFVFASRIKPISVYPIKDEEIFE